jgi:hypothetical protein
LAQLIEIEEIHLEIDRLGGLVDIPEQMGQKGLSGVKDFFGVPMGFFFRRGRKSKNIGGKSVHKRILLEGRGKSHLSFKLLVLFL